MVRTDAAHRLALVLADTLHEHGFTLVEVLGRVSRPELNRARVACYRAAHAAGYSIRELAAVFGRDPVTISRKLRAGAEVQP